MPLDTEVIRFTAAQIPLIRPGLADLMAEYHYVACTGCLRQPRVDENGRELPAELPSSPQLAVITSALDKLDSLKGRAVTMSVTTLELLAFILGLRLTDRLLRLGRLPRIRNHRQRARRLIRRLENDGRRALARYLEVHGPEEYSRVQLEWQATVRALRRHLVPSDSALQRMNARNVENTRTPAGAEVAGSLPEASPISSPAAHLHLDLSFLDVEVPGPTAHDPGETGVRPASIGDNTGVDQSAAETPRQVPSEPALEQRLQVERDRQTGEYSTAVARAIIGVLEQAPDLYAGNRRSVAQHLGRCLANTDPKAYSDITPAADIDVVLSQCKPRRAVAPDGPATLNFYMSWLLTAMDRLAPDSEIRKRVARIIQVHDFVRTPAPPDGVRT